MKFLLNRLPILVLLCSLCAACNRELDIESDEPSRLFIAGFMHPDSIISIRLTHSLGLSDIVDADSASVHNALVRVFENGQLVDTLVEVRPGIYQSARQLAPVQGHLYHFTAEALGFPVITTVADSIPPSLPVASIDAEYVPTFEHVATLTLSVHLSRPVTEDLIGIQFHYFSTFSLNPGYIDVCIGNRTLVCDRLSVGAFVKGFCLEDYYCVNQYEDITLYTPELSFYDGSPARFTLATFSPRSIELAYKTGLSDDAYTNNYEVNPFYSPIYLPIEVEGGYAAIFFYNTYDQIFQF